MPRHFNFGKRGGETELSNSMNVMEIRVTFSATQN